MDRTESVLVDFVLSLEVRAARAVPAFVCALVYVPVVTHTREHFLDDRFMLGIGCTDKEVVRSGEPGREGFEALSVAVSQRLRLDAKRVRRIGNGLAMLVGTSEKEHVLATLTVMASHHVRGDRRVRVSQVGSRVDVVDGGGYVEGHDCSHATGGRSDSSPRSTSGHPEW